MEPEPDTLAYRPAGDAPPAPGGRPFRTWMLLLLVWVVGLAVWGVYLVVIFVVLIRLLFGGTPQPE